MRQTLIIRILLLVAALTATNGWAQPRFVSFGIPVRDGKTLAADLFSIDTSIARPLIVIQTPYNKFFLRYTLGAPEATGTVLLFDSVHYNYLTVDWRGFYASSSAGSPGYDRGLDGYDIIEWAAEQRWCNGRVGTWGVSALGLIQFETMKHRPPHHVCAMPMMKDYKTKYTDFFPGGVYKKEYTESLQQLGFLATTSILAHPTHDFSWTLSEAATDYPESVAVPVLIVGGWFDLFPDDVIRAFEDIQSRSYPAFRSLHKMIMGPWLHARMEDTVQGAMRFPNATGIVTSVAQEFFDYCLRGMENGYSSRPAFSYYQMGEDAWRHAQLWTGLANKEDTLFFSYQSLTPYPIISDIAGETYQSDPRLPSPAVGGPRFNPFDSGIPAGPQDQRHLVESRTDVLQFTTEPLDSPLEIDGAVKVVLDVITNRTDTDYTIRLCDVYPDGTSMLMTQGVRRLRFRDSFSSPTLAVPGSQYQMVITLGNLALTLQPGHALRLDVSSSAYPQYDLNLNNGGTMYTAGDTLVAQNTVLYSSRVLIPSREPSAVQGGLARLPETTALLHNYPNPFNAKTVVSSQLSVASRVRLAVYDLLGREVTTLLDEQKEAGTYHVEFDGTNLSSGVYICRLQVGGRVEARRMMLLK